MLSGGIAGGLGGIAGNPAGMLSEAKVTEFNIHTLLQTSCSLE